MLYRPSSFRKTAFALTTVAALAGTSALSAFPANAQQAVNYSAPYNCTTLADPGRRAICESVQRTEAAKAELVTEAALKKCLGQIIEYKKTVQPADFAKLGPITRETACGVAAKLPKQSASLN